MKHVVVTGVSRGLGRAMAMSFAADGWTVSGCDTDAAALQSLADELGPDHHAQACDVTDPPPLAPLPVEPMFVEPPSQYKLLPIAELVKIKAIAAADLMAFIAEGMMCLIIFLLKVAG